MNRVDAPADKMQSTNCHEHQCSVVVMNVVKDVSLSTLANALNVLLMA